MDFEAGTRVDRYVLVEPLGEGGQGAVWKASDPLDPSRPCALKLVPVSASRPADVERARREARALAKLEHPSLVRCHALFEDLKHGVLGLSMEWVDGTSLKKLVQNPRFSQKEREITLEHVARALAYLHDSGVVHRDVKLDNVLVDSAFLDQPNDPEHVKLVDLGIARVPDAGAELTAIGTVVGTIAYLAPELCDPATFEGKPNDPTVDVFAFGVMGCLLLSGRHPTGLPAQSSLVEYTRAYRRFAGKGAHWPEAKPEGKWGEVLSAALALSPSDRIANAHELLARIEGEPAQPTSVATPAAMHADTALAVPAHKKPSLSELESAATVAIGASAPPEKTTRSGPWAWIAGGSLLVAIGLGVYISHVLNSDTETRAVPSASARTPVASAKNARTQASSEAGSLETTDASLDATLVVAPTVEDPCDAGCVSGRGCGGECDAGLDTDQPFSMRTGGLIDAEGRSLFLGNQTAEICVSIPDYKKEACTRLADIADGGVATPALYVEGLDLAVRRFDVSVKQTLPGRGSAELARKTDVTFKDKVDHNALCKGLIVEFPNYAGRVILFLDEPDAGTPRRCP